jgi:uncharacterized protein YdaU (DUF1376 family)
LPLWTDAYLADTIHLDALESGAYLHLLMAAWRLPDCSLPDDDKLLARWAKCQPRQWARIRETVMGFWQKDDDGKWTQKRLLSERKRVNVKSDKAAHAARTKHLKNNNSSHADAPLEHVPQGCQPEPEPKPEEDSVPTERPPDAFVYEFGKQVLGQKAGGLISKLIAACEGDLGRAYGALVDAAGKQDSREYIGAVCRGPPGSRPVAELMAELEDEVRHAAE